MATLSRPDVEISQELQVESPTIGTPALVPTIVGPCFQIVEPITDLGTLNSQAVVTTAASIYSDAALSTLLTVSGKLIYINVNDTGPQTISFDSGGVDVSQSWLINAINRQLTGAVAEFRENKLYIQTNSKGANASIVLLTHVDNCYTALGFTGWVGLTVRGQGNYDNMEFLVQYEDLPSPLAAIDEIVVDEDNLDFYRYQAGTLVEISEDSAIAVNSYYCTDDTALSSTLFSNGAMVHGMQPALTVGRTGLWGVPTGTSSVTNTLVHKGTEASLTLPMGADISPNGPAFPDLDPLGTWPDPRGVNYLQVDVIGLSNYWSTGLAADIGTLIGSEGNGVYVIFTQDLGLPAGTALATFSTPFITVTYNAPTWTGLAAAFTASTFVSAITGTLTVTLVTDGVGASTALLPPSATNYYCGGGSDPVNFSGPVGVTTDDQKASITGAAYIGAGPGGFTAAQLGIDGEILSVAVDGGPWLDITLTGAVVTCIDNALTAAFPVVTPTAAVATPPNKNSYTAAGSNVLQLQTGSSDGHDSTLQVKASDAVIEALFSGAETKTSSAVAAFDSNYWGGGADPHGWGAFAGVGNAFDVGTYGRVVSIAQTDYNWQAAQAQEKALEPGNTIITLTNVTTLAALRSDATVAEVAALAAAGAQTLVITHSVAGATAILAPNFVGDLTIQDVADTINGVINGSALDHYVAAGVVGVVGSERLVISGTLGDGTITLSGVSAGLTTFLDHGATIVGETASPDTGVTIVLNDGDDSPMYGLQVASVSNAFSGQVNPPATTSVATMTAYVLGGYSTPGAGTEVSAIDYTTGDMQLALAGDSDPATGDLQMPIVALVDASTRAVVTYKRMWPNAIGSTVPDYEGMVYHGRSTATLLSDSLYDTGTMLGRVSSIQTWSVSGHTYPGAMLKLSAQSVTARSTKSNWYVYAENLPTTGRVAPEGVSTALESKYTLKAALNRDTSGITRAGTSPIYVGYKALRLDVTDQATTPGLLVFDTVDEMEAAIGPIDLRNPLAMGFYLGFLNTTDISLTGLGVSQVTSDAPTGTLEAYDTAFNYLELAEVYAMAPLTFSESVFQKLSLHATNMSVASGKKERIGIVCGALPTEKDPLMVASATFKITALGGGLYELTMSDETEASLYNLAMLLDGKLDAGGSAITGAVGESYLPEQGLFIDRAGDGYRYLVTRVTGTDSLIITTNDGFTPGVQGPDTAGNDDGYYLTGADAISNLASFEADGEVCSLRVRQAALSKTTTAGKLNICTTLAEITGGPTGYQNRRLFYMQPEYLKTTLDGTEVLIPGYYGCAMVAAQVGQQRPEQPFTNLPIVGPIGVSGSSDIFTETQMATAAAGGVYWLIQDTPGGAVTCRHQLSTDVSSLKTKELSLTKAVDYVAKLIRSVARPRVGRYNITKGYLENMSMTVGASLGKVSGEVVAEAELLSIGVADNEQDAVELEITLVTFKPANRIRFKLYV